MLCSPWTPGGLPCCNATKTPEGRREYQARGKNAYWKSDPLSSSTTPPGEKRAQNSGRCGGGAWREGDVCAEWAFTRRANSVTENGAKVAGWTFLKGAERRWRSGGCAFTENLQQVHGAFSQAYVAALAVVRLVSILTRALSTGTGAVLGWGREVTWKADAFYNGSPALCQDVYLTDGADATQRARAERVLVRGRFVFAWKHFTLQTVALNGALWQLMSFWFILQW